MLEELGFHECDKFHDKETNEGFLLGCDVKKSRFGSEGKKKNEITLKTAFKLAN